MTVTPFPFEDTIKPTNHARMEFMYSVCDGLPRARQKRLIVMAALHDIRFITPQEAQILIDSLGLKED